MIDGADAVLEFFKYYGSTDHWRSSVQELLRIDDLFVEGYIEIQYRKPGTYSLNSNECYLIYARCNDTFAWGGSDSEDITVENMPILIQTVEDVEPLIEFAPHDDEGYERYMSGLRCTVADLFAARVRKMRPQGACYSRYPVATWFLFDDCGPERAVEFGNPYPQGGANGRYEARW